MPCKYTRITAKIYVDLLYITEYVATCLRCATSVVNSDNKIYVILDTIHKIFVQLHEVAIGVSNYIND